LLLHESLRVAMGQHGAEIVGQKYTFDVFRTGLETILDKAERPDRSA
jgi:hypothetical protein